MAVKLRPLSPSDPLLIEESEYQALVARKEQKEKGPGWSHCADETEWLAKLHYLREGFKAGKLTPQDFRERESRLVESWLRQGV